MQQLQRAKVIKPRELATLRYPLPESWKKAAGLLKGRKLIDPVEYQRTIRKEWESRLKRQYHLGLSHLNHDSR